MVAKGRILGIIDTSPVDAGFLLVTDFDHPVRPPRRGCYLFALVPTFCNLLDLFFPDAELSKFSLHYDSVDVS